MPAEQDHRHVARARAEIGRGCQPGGGEQHPGGQYEVAPKRSTRRGASVDAATIASVIGRKSRPVSSALVPEHLLQVQREEEPHREERRAEQEDRRRWPPAARACAKIRSGISGELAKRALDQRERPRAARRRRPSGSEHAGRAPAEGVGADDPEDERGQAGGDDDSAGGVEIVLEAGCARPARCAGRRRRPRRRSGR